MQKTLFLLVLISSAQAGLVDECDFDQNTRIEEDIKLKNKFPGSYLTDGDLVLAVPVDGGEVRIGIGGCVDFGVRI